MDFSYQLYSARNGGPLEETLRTLKDLGYTQVEGWGGQFDNPQALADALKAVGLSMPTAHMGFNQLEDTGRAAEIAQLIGIETYYCPAPPSADYREGKGDWSEFGRRLGKVGEALTAKGIGFGYHNHNWEFTRAADGRFPLDIVLSSATGLQWEMDLAWLVKGGEEPLAWMDKYGGRMTALHVKDLAPAGEKLDEDGWADVGTGTLDWKALIEAAKEKTAVRYFVAEHDKPSDPIRFARQSIAAVKQWM